MSHFRKTEIVGLSEKPICNFVVDKWAPMGPDGAQWARAGQELSIKNGAGPKKKNLKVKNVQLVRWALPQEFFVHVFIFSLNKYINKKIKDLVQNKISLFGLLFKTPNAARLADHDGVNYSVFR